MARRASQLEGFSDAVFGFVLTLLVISMQVPRTLDQLLELMAGIPSFAMAFVVLLVIWYRHFVFFRRYGLQDPWTMVLNGGLLFLVAVYAYPLKFYFNFAFGAVREDAVLREDQVVALIVSFIAGLCGVFFVFAALYLHAYKQRQRLELSDDEAAETLRTARRFFYFVAAAVVVIVLAFALPAGEKWYSLLAMLLAWIARTIEQRRAT